MARILLVEDDDDTRESLAGILASALGAEVDTAPDGAAGRARLEASPRPYDLVLTDERMPGLAGRELLAWVGEREPRTRRVLMSAYDDGAAIAQEAGADLFVRKPFELPRLMAELRSLLGPGGGRGSAWRR